MDFTQRLSEIDAFLEEGRPVQAITVAGSVLEDLLRELYLAGAGKMNATDQRDITDAVSRVAPNKAITDLTLGQLAGVYRDAKLFEKLEQKLNRKMPRLKSGDFNGFIDIRNRATHPPATASEDDARWAAAQVRIWLREAGMLADEKAKGPQKAASGDSLKPWTQCVRLNDDVESGETATAAYAIHLGDVIANNPGVPQLYREADAFFRATHPTASMQRLVKDTLAQLAGGPGDRVLQLRSPFGGGKSHLLLALYHAVHDRKALLKHWPDATKLANPGQVRVAWFDGEKFDVQGAKVDKNTTVRTLWGWMAWRLGGKSFYDLVAWHDERRIAPGGDVVSQLVRPADGTATLILMDEVLKYFERAQADTTAVGDSTLSRQTLDFIQTLTSEVANSKQAVMIYSLQASVREAFGNSALLNMLDHLTDRVDAKREPISGDEILPVLQKRLLAEISDEAIADKVSTAYAETLSNYRSSKANDAAGRRVMRANAETLRKRFRAAYPFHPWQIDLMSGRWASIPDFQRTRGAIRFLAQCLSKAKRNSEARYLLGPGDIPLADADVLQAFFTEVGQREGFSAVVKEDFTGSEARIRRIDIQLSQEFPHLSGMKPAMRLATAILMYSFGGATTQDGATGATIQPGVSERDILEAVIGPDLDALTAETVLKRLRENCLYLHFDGARYLFKTTANVNKLLDEEADKIEHADGISVKERIRKDLSSQLTGRTNAILWPEQTTGIRDEEPRFLLAYLPFDGKPSTPQEQRAQLIDIFEHCGSDLRKYRNGLGLVLPEARQVEPLRRATRYLLAIERLRSNAKAHGISPEQLAQLKERELTEKAAYDSAMRNLYVAVWLPKMNAGALDVERVETGGRALGAAGMHERLMELLTVFERKVFTSLATSKLIQLLRLGEAEQGPDASLGMPTDRIVSMFYGSPDFPRLESDSVIRKAIVQGVKSGAFGFVGRSNAIKGNDLKEGGLYRVPRQHVAISRDLPEEEIDLSSGFIVLPGGIEPEQTSSPTSEQGTTPPAATSSPSSRPEYVVSTGAPLDGQTRQQQQTRVQFRMKLNRQQLYASFGALGNLAERAGTITLIVDAEMLSGFDSSWLRNAVFEPLDEADVSVEDNTND